MFKVFSSEHELHIGGAPWFELERMDSTNGVLPLDNDIHLVQIHTRMHVYKAILRPRAIHHHWSILIV